MRQRLQSAPKLRMSAVLNEAVRDRTLGGYDGGGDFVDRICTDPQPIGSLDPIDLHPIP